MTYLIIPDDEFGIDELMLIAVLYEYFKERNVTPILKSIFRTIHSDLREIPNNNPEFKISSKPKVINDYLPRNKKGKIIQDTTPFYNKFARAGHKKR